MPALRGAFAMLMRTSRYHDLRVEHERAVSAREQAIKDLRLARAEVAQLREDLHGRERDYVERLIGRTVIVHLRSDFSMEGGLVGVYKNEIILRNVHVSDPETGNVENLGGDQVIPRDNVAWVQEPQ